MHRRPHNEENNGTSQVHLPPSELSELADHRCYLLYPMQYRATMDLEVVDPLPHLELTLGNLLANPNGRPVAWLTTDARDTASAKQREQPVWEETPLEVGSDLHPHIRRLLGGAADTEEDGHARTFRLSEPMRRLIHGRLLRVPPEMPEDRRRPKQLGLSVGKAALQRLQARCGADCLNVLGLSIDDVRLIVFRTGVGMLIVDVRFVDHRSGEPPHPYWLVEAVTSLARFSQLRWYEPDGQALADSESFSLADVAYSVSGISEAGKRADRVFTATYVQFDTAPDRAAARHYAIQLSRHYTDDYQIAEQPENIRFVADFSNVIHALALEGSATIVYTAPPPGLAVAPFLQDFRTATFERHYLPIMVLAVHEFVTLVQLTNDSSFWLTLDDEKSQNSPVSLTQRRPPHAKQDKPAPEERLRNLRDHILRFRLCYRFTYVSYISMHNAVNRKLREVLGLDWMLQELDRDTDEIDAYLKRRSEQRMEENARLMEQRFRWASIIGSFTLTWLTAFTFVKELLEAFHVCQTIASVSGVISGILAGLVAIWVGRHKTHKHLHHHAMHEHIEHQALNQ